ncbi:MAG: NCS1 family transporter [Lachnospiraceae bacterium]
MSENNTTVVHHHSTLDPIPANKRILGISSYLFAWLGGCVSIGTFTLGSSVVETGLNLYQAFLAMLIGSLILIIGLVVNDRLCYKTGIPYVIQLKSAFGAKGNIVPSMLRAAPAIVWYGVQSWLAGTAMNTIAKTMFGYDNIVLFFIVFQLIQLSLSLLGFQGIKWLENIGACFIIGALIYMFYVCTTTYSTEIKALIDQEGSWGMPFVSAIISFFGVNITVMLNCGDYVRELKTGYSIPKRGVIYFLAMVPATVFMGIIGLMLSSATGIANPITAFSQAIDNKFLVVITLLFILFAQMTTNLLSNVIPPTYALIDAFKLKHKTAAILVSILAVCTFPWELTKETSAAGLDTFVLIYTAFFGPIFAVLTTDYYFVRKQKMNLDDLYDDKGPFAGINWAAIIAIAVGAIIGLFNVSISFFTATIPTALVYYFLMKKMKSSKPFCKGTDLEEKNTNRN